MQLKHIFLTLALAALVGGSSVAQEAGGSETEAGKAGQPQAFQLSLVPGVGTNFAPAGRAVNHVSINLLAGYNYGLKGVELGGVINIDRSDVRYAQLAGFGNLVGGNVTGLQAAGFFNANKGALTKGVQAAGFANLNRSMTGAQLAGFTNLSLGNVTGAQFSGFYNQSGDFKGAQGAGFHNHARSVDGLQLAGFSNIALDSVHGAQLSSFFNHAKHVDGLQASGFVNHAKTVKGVQLGIINIADTVEKGVTIGLVNIVRKGMLQFELSTNDVTDLNLQFKSGTPRLYGIVGAGLETRENGIWAYSSGFGTQFNPLRNKIYTAVEISAHSLNRQNDGFEDKLNLVNKLSLDVGYQFTRSISVNAGPVLNVYVTNMYDADSQSYGFDIGNNPIFEELSGNTHVRMWIGYHAGVRF